jgi:hypothetical protein
VRPVSVAPVKSFDGDDFAFVFDLHRSSVVFQFAIVEP